PPTTIFTLSLHDALPIYRPEADLDAVVLREIIYRVAIPIAWADELMSAPWEVVAERPWIITPEHSSHRALVMELFHDRSALPARSEEHTSELQSPDHLVC